MSIKPEQRPRLRQANASSVDPTPRLEVWPATALVDGLDGADLRVWVDRMCNRFRDQPAIRWRERSISYAELDGMANRLANALMARNLGSGSIVAVCLDDRVQIIASLLGTLRAGCVFAPLDPDSPPERLRRILQELQPACFITDERNGGKLDTIRRQELPASQTLCLKGVSAEMAIDSVSSSRDGVETESCVPVDPGKMSYIYYTSGSTGIPKGIMGTLKGLSHFVKWEIETFSITPGTRVSQLTTPTFDAFLRDVFVPLCVGGVICIPPDPPPQMDPEVLVDWIDKEQIGLVHCVPSTFAVMVGACTDSHALESLKYILLAGEVLPVSDVGKWMNRYGSEIKLVNLYGSTETTMIKFYHIVEESDAARGFVPIGKPMRGARALVLDDGKQVCPQGAVGEIYIRSPYLTLGYYKQPELTREVFVPNPFSGKADDLIFKTGDLARVLDDGNFQFIGRKDQQVKIRGLRVELGEIEAVLREHESVLAAVVAVYEDESGGKALVGYVVPRTGGALSTSQLRRFLKDRIPDYMMPAVIIPLDELPLTSSGKVDRKKLPVPPRTRPELEAEYVAPRSATERIVAALWGEVLDVERVGVFDDFFDLGGHSLLAIQVVSRLRDSLRVEVPVRKMFAAPTVAGLVDTLCEKPGQRARLEKTAELLWKVEQLSESQVDTMLDARRMQESREEDSTEACRDGVKEQQMSGGGSRVVRR